MSEETSIELSNGAAVGFTGHIHDFDANVETELDHVMMEIGKWVESEAEIFLGHIKMAITSNDKSITLNLTDLEEGVKHHNILGRVGNVHFNFMVAVTDVDEHKLKDQILHIMKNSKINFCLEEHECSCEHDEHHDKH
ncbi:MAG: hypothetical protein MJY64_02730 [archaeon]|nr:hypothetical protein [archaeon]